MSGRYVRPCVVVKRGSRFSHGRAFKVIDAVCCRVHFLLRLTTKKPNHPFWVIRLLGFLGYGRTLLLILSREHSVEGAPGELGALNAGGHVRDVLELGGLVQVFQVLL